MLDDLIISFVLWPFRFVFVFIAVVLYAITTFEGHIGFAGGIGHMMQCSLANGVVAHCNECC